MFENHPADRLPQLDAMRAGIDLRLEIRVRDYKLLVRPLTVNEVVQVVSNVGDALLKLPDHARTSIQENTLIAKETLKLASTSDYGANDPTISDYILDRMLPDELQYVHRQYVQACDRVNPAMEMLPKETLDALVGEIKKNTSLLTNLSFLELVNVCRYLILGE